MLRKRLVGVITVLDGWAVQSFGYSRYLPLGKPECLAENLDRWGADEILVMSIDRTRRNLGPDLDLLRRLAALGLSTPLTYGGGVRSLEDAAAVVRSGADRLCVDNALHRHPRAVREIAALVGAQAVIGVLPLARNDDALLWRDHVSGAQMPLDDVDLSLFTEQVASEALIVDCAHEGSRASFDTELVRRFPLAETPLIAFGGISDAGQIADLFVNRQVVACGVGNFLAYREHAIQELRRALSGSLIRPPEFRTEL